ncbi:MAG: linear amide C-N hydrolase [Bacteroidota bacterium]
MKQVIITIETFLLFIILFKAESINGCTAFCLVEKGNYIFVGKNLDWPIGDGFIIVNPRGIKKIGSINSTDKPAKWTSKYGSVTFNQFGKDHPLGGMNEKGLVVEELSYSPTIYPNDDSLFCLNELQWIQYQLDNYASVVEVISNLENIQISKLLFGLHYFLSDNSGNSAVIEFIDGKSLTYYKDELPFPILVNNAYSNSLKYIYKHEGFGGSLPVREGQESPSRFVRVGELLRDCNTSNTNYAFKILDNVKQHDTQWSIVYDILNFNISFFTKNNSNIKTMNLEEIDFTSTHSMAYSLTEGKSKTQNKLIDFSIITYEYNRTLLNKVFNKMVELNEIDSVTAEEIKTIILE